jgi:hypothetical protein
VLVVRAKMLVVRNGGSGQEDERKVNPLATATLKLTDTLIKDSKRLRLLIQYMMGV